MVLTANKVHVDSVMKQIGFPVSKEPIFIQREGNLIEVPGQKAVTRHDTGDVLSIVSDGYGLVSHDKVLEPAIEALDKLGFNFNRVGFAKKGARVIVEASSEEIVLVNGEQHKPRIQMLNSYDRTTSLIVTFGLYRLVCLNGATAPSDVYQFRAHHHSNLEEEFKLWKNNLDTDKWIDTYVEYLSQLDNRKVDEDTTRKLLAKIFPNNPNGSVSGSVEKSIEKAISGDGQDGLLTLWSLWNGITETVRDFENKAEASSLVQRVERSNKVLTQAQKILIAHKN